MPTGCPTSQIIAYYAYEDMFEEVNCITKQNNCVFTLYVDDMTFSSFLPFDLYKICDTVNSVLRKYGHRLKVSKTKYCSQKDFKLITGVAVTPDNKLKTSNNLQN